jgi:hypothetical protein
VRQVNWVRVLFWALAAATAVLVLVAAVNGRS